MLKIVHASSEVVPFSKTGGLADVVGSLPAALAEKGHKVSIITPLYGSVDRAKNGVTPLGKSLSVRLKGRTEHFQLYHSTAIQGVDTYLLEHEGFFNRDSLYTTKQGDYPDNYLRFSFFAAAILELVNQLDLSPDVLHLHDWQTAMAATYNHVNYGGFLKTVLTIHNLAYQGLFPSSVLEDIGLDWNLFNPRGVEFYGKVNFLKAGLVYADRLTTVSPTYAQEIRTPQFGNGLEGVLRERGDDLVGILNGVDYSKWSPETDKLIPANYDVKKIKGKETCKKELCKAFGIDYEKAQPLFGVVGRLAFQKGFDVLAQVLPKVVKTGASVVILGTGESAVEDALRNAEKAADGRVSLKVAFDNALAHLIEAGSDFFVMPSRYEPCGLNQMYSMRYGTVPVVHAVGGLRDTVIDYDTGDRASGFAFTGLTPSALYCAMVRGVELFRRPKDFQALRRRIMGLDYSWKQSANAYEKLYEDLIQE